MRQPLRISAATLQIACGALAVLACGAAVAGWADGSGVDVDGARSIFFGIVAVLGIGLLIVWSRARSRRRWLVALMIITGALAAAMLLITIVIIRPARFDAHRGLWTTAWTAALDVLLWVIIVAACVVELRALAGRGGEESGDRPWWHAAAGVAAPLALLTVLVILLVTAAPGWMVRANSTVTAGAAAVPQQPSTLSGRTRWQIDLDTDQPPLPTRSGLAVPVAADQGHNAGVVMLDPTSGRVRWRYQIRGLSAAPSLQSTEGGRSVVVGVDGRDAADDMSDQTFTLSADTGQLRAFWPSGGGDPQGSDPPVYFDHVAQGTNSAVAVSPTTGRRLWRYRPERCADPRDVTSTPTVVLVYAYRCDDEGADLIGLDPKTGDRRWAQQVADSDRPDQVLVRPGYQLEGDPKALQRRDLTTGRISWTTPARSDCLDDSTLVGSTRTAFAATCVGDTDGPTTLTAYDLESGRELWQRRGGQPMPSMVAVDDDRVLALQRTDRTCTVSLLTRSAATPLKTFAEDFRNTGYSSPFKPGSVHCNGSQVLRVGDSYLLALHLVRDPKASSVADEPRYRFIGLS
ncbi:outer membrane protein assembly factor BamB family protein [Microlunatus soli]|uniref:Outer membrane protein assembly factor BamB, contains PQQ-like beta-propeller repeat n=1 Tax=Microlunatus soli TaxID=630515 RepID=A0A1H1V4U1_9ACTN|nr:PQQ-binding-like beta-propeller repeat protein [Microlunatus soli]SDS79640.1 Outer membrane protein assembly factor BamB, contains PQQ-like beta-propeller repeat [Microlunatus soli]